MRIACGARPVGPAFGVTAARVESAYGGHRDDGLGFPAVASGTASERVGEVRKVDWCEPRVDADHFRSLGIGEQVHRARLPPRSTRTGVNVTR